MGSSWAGSSWAERPFGERPLPPLRDLPPPPRVSREDPSLVLPQEIIADSRREITFRIWRSGWAAALMLMGLWYVLLTFFVIGSGPTLWWISALMAIAEPVYLRQAAYSLGFDPGLLKLAYLLLPLLATALSAALVPLASAWIGRMNPRDHLTEHGFQRAVAERVTLVLLLPPIAALVLIPLAVLVRVPLPWSTLSSGPLAALCASGIAVLIARWCLRARMTAPRVLGIEAAAKIDMRGKIDHDLEVRRTAARRSRAQDRRHLPPNPGTPEASGASTPAGALRALALIGRASLAWVWPAMLSLAWVVLSITETIEAFSGVLEMDLTAVRSSLRWPMAVLAIPAAGIIVLVTALSPAIAALIAAPQRAEVRDLRTVPEWATRARQNPWERSLVIATGVVTGAGVLLAVIVFGVGLVLLGEDNALMWTTMVLTVLVGAPLAGGAAFAAMRDGARDVFYGPPGLYMRRETPYALVAPLIGTRAQHAEDPAVRSEMRRRERGTAIAGGRAGGIAGGERLWVDPTLPGAVDTQVRPADVAAGRLPDFGADSSPFAAAPSPSDDDIPDSVTGLRRLP